MVKFKFFVFLCKQTKIYGRFRSNTSRGVSSNDWNTSVLRNHYYPYGSIKMESIHKSWIRWLEISYSAIQYLYPFKNCRKTRKLDFINDDSCSRDLLRNIYNKLAQ